MLTMGLGIGARSAKCVIFEEELVLSRQYKKSRS
jgi:hypothetical protein